MSMFLKQTTPITALAFRYKTINDTSELHTGTYLDIWKLK